MRTSLSTLLIFIGLLIGTAQPAQAAPSPAAKGALVGLGTTGGAIVGGLTLGAAGAFIGGTTCGAGAECWSPIIYGGGGAIIGAVGGSIGGAILGAKSLKVHQAPFGRNLAITTGVSIAFIGLTPAGSSFLALGGIGIALGVPIVAGITATQIAKNTESTASVQLSITPLVQRKQRGLVATLVF